MTTHGRLLARWCTAALLMLALFPRSAVGLSLTFRDLVDPVPPAGTLTYLIGVNSEGEGEIPEAYCFNPPPQCVTFPATCSIGSVACVGNSFTGYVCENAVNAGANCGVGDPPVPDTTLCVPMTTGTCSGGANAGLPCASSAECPGETFVCEHSFNEGEFCGTGNPPQPEPSYCLANPIGICSAGLNMGLPCTAPHGQPTEQCPPDDGSPATEHTIVTLFIPSMTTFLDDDSGGTSDGEVVTWNVPFQPCAGPDGVSGMPPCPVLQARLMVDPEAPIGAVIESQVTATAPDGEVAIRSTRTKVGTFRLLRFNLFYPRRPDRDRFIYRAFVTLNPEAEIDLTNEALRIQLDTAEGSLLDLELPAGRLRESSKNTFTFRTWSPGINRLAIREVHPSFYRIALRATKMTLPDPADPDVTLTLTLGDDVMSHPVLLVPANSNRRFVGQQ